MPSFRIPDHVLSNCTRIDLDSGEIFSDGQERAGAVLVESGLLLVSATFADGSRSVRIAGAGEVVGEEALFGDPANQRIEALVDSAICVLRMTGARTELPVMHWVMEQLSAQLREASREIHWMRSYSVDNRVQLHLLALFEKTGGLEIPIPQSDFAHLVGATRETISTALNRLARADVIRLSRRSIQVIRPERLGLRRSSAATGSR